MIRPRASFTGETVSETSMRSPLLRTRTVSKWSMLSPLQTRASTSSCLGQRSRGMIKVIRWPTASAAVQLNMAWAARFHEVMTPSSVLLTMASSAESTMAASRARASSPRRRSLMSRAVFEAPMTSPFAFLIGDTVREISKRVPSFRMRVISKCSIFSPWLMRARISSSSASRSGGMTIVMDRPTASAAVQPKIRSAAGFHDVMRPSSVLLTMASSDESTIAATQAALSSSDGNGVVNMTPAESSGGATSYVRESELGASSRPAVCVMVPERAARGRPQSRAIGKNFHTGRVASMRRARSFGGLDSRPREIGDHRAEDLNVDRLREESVEAEGEDSRAVTRAVRAGQSENPARPAILARARPRLTQEPDAILGRRARIADHHGGRRRLQEADGLARAAHRPDIRAVHREECRENRAVFAVGLDQDDAHAIENFVGKPLLVHGRSSVSRLQWTRHDGASFTFTLCSLRANGTLTRCSLSGHARHAMTSATGRARGRPDSARYRSVCPPAGRYSGGYPRRRREGRCCHLAVLHWPRRHGFTRR